ncbi:hypothetical protein [Galbibacter pacificus]|uniref:Uncharacterized protein n=1 Tax=Galbibacter pacificus TaxID=2996052 RepID=A0ABT6FMU0_9FLAO|nr:hypothetical protein [Galbibacter pacificus]MDG3581105.1 hypothetical protein [Galbibacter pacificus]MDG3584583.1 hypothetical protein [Galbibacter pacificus]
MSRTAAPYLILNSKKPEHYGTLFVKYWTKDREEANNINAFSKLSLYNGVAFEKDSLVFISSTIGGRYELTNSDKIYAYRESLISNERVVTRQDIVILCQKHYKDAIQDVEVKNGIQTSLENNVGYTPYH